MLNANHWNYIVYFKLYSTLITGYIVSSDLKSVINHVNWTFKWLYKIERDIQCAWMQVPLLFQNLKSMWRLTECNTWLWARWCRPCWPDSRRRWFQTPAEPGCPHWYCPGRSPSHWWGGVSLHTDCPLLEWRSPPGALKSNTQNQFDFNWL